MEGASYTDLIAEAKKAGVRSIIGFTPPGAETVEVLCNRAKDFFCEICKYVIDALLYIVNALLYACTLSMHYCMHVCVCVSVCVGL